MDFQVGTWGLNSTEDHNLTMIAIDPDLDPNHYRIALRTAPHHTIHYAPILTSLIGQHAVNYMFLHYYSAGSTVVVANAYAAHRDSARRFVDHMVQVGMPPRQAAYLWTIIAPETIDHPQSEFSFFRWAAVVRALGRGGASALQWEQGAGPDPNSVSGENDHVEPSDMEQDAVTSGVPSGVDASTEIDEAGGGDTDSGPVGLSRGKDPTTWKSTTKLITSISPKENTNTET